MSEKCSTFAAQNDNPMKRKYWLLAVVISCAISMRAQSDDHIADGLASVAKIAAETQEVDPQQDSAAVQTPEWKKKLYFGYIFDIYYHDDSRVGRKENGWSFTFEPELGWRMQDNLYLGMRLGGSYQDTYTTYTRENLDGTTESEMLRIQQGSWNVTPYVRYRVKTLFNDKVGIWLEGHLYTGMEFPRVTDGIALGTDYNGLRHSVIYGAQISPVITYQFSSKRSFQIFFSILSLGYSGTTFFYTDPLTGLQYNEYTNDVIVFSGKLKNLLANQFTPGLYGLKFGIQKSF